MIREFPVDTPLQLIAVVEHCCVGLVGDGVTASAEGVPITLVMERHAVFDDRQILRRRD